MPKRKKEKESFSPRLALSTNVGRDEKKIQKKNRKLHRRT
jgi:hypothetical protein